MASTSPPPLEAVPPGCWHYKAEGAANITLRFEAGAACMPADAAAFYRNKVLRLAKVRVKPEDSVVQGAGAAPVEAGPASICRSGAPPAPLHGLPASPLVFSRDVMRPLLGHAYVIPAREVTVSGEYLVALAAQAEGASARPDKRRRGPGVALPPPSSPSATVVVMTDHSQLPLRGAEGEVTTSRPHAALCVEIKPKCGVAPSTGPLAAAGVPCRYCCHQLLKAQEAVADVDSASLQSRPSQLAPHLSHYCPLDLYSGEGARVRRALAALATSPQNNFRLFVDGACVELGGACGGSSGGDNGGALAVLEAALAGAGVAGTAASDAAAARFPRVDALLTALAAVLSRDPVLKTLARVQAADGGGTAAALEAAAALQSVEAGSSSEGELDAARRTLASYFIAATAKDCSLLIPLQLRPSCPDRLPVPLPPPLSPSSAGEWEVAALTTTAADTDAATGPSLDVTYAVAVVDLDPKPVGRLPSYAALEERLAGAWRSVGADAFAAAGKVCQAALL